MQTKDETDFHWVFLLASMCQVSLLGFAVGGAFLSLAYFDLPYNLLVMLVVTERWLNAELVAKSQSAPTQENQGAVQSGLPSPRDLH
jgi:hypothetical protein